MLRPSKFFLSSHGNLTLTFSPPVSPDQGFSFAVLPPSLALRLVPAYSLLVSACLIYLPLVSPPSSGGCFFLFFRPLRIKGSVTFPGPGKPLGGNAMPFPVLSFFPRPNLNMAFASFSFPDLRWASAHRLGFPLRFSSNQPGWPRTKACLSQLLNVVAINPPSPPPPASACYFLTALFWPASRTLFHGSGVFSPFAHPELLLLFSNPRECSK